MCSIMGICGAVQDWAAFQKGFDRTLSRGPDESRVLEVGGGVLAFHRLAIMGLTEAGMQPFQLGKSAVVCNGEIYGFEKLRMELERKGYTFQSGSDCEVLLPLYREYSTAMFSMLDAEFALILYDGEREEFVAARDPIGIRPLYYGYDEKGTILFASEPKNLVGLCGKILPSRLAAIIRAGNSTASEICPMSRRSAGMTRTQPVKRSTKSWWPGWKNAWCPTPKWDSSCRAGWTPLWCVPLPPGKVKTPIRTFAIGMEGDAIDLKYARQVADFIGSHHTEVFMTPKEVIDSLEEVILLLGTYDITTIRASMGMYLVCKYIHQHTDIRVLLTGEISDELFGYKYTDFAPSPEAFQKESEKRVRELHMYDVLRADRCISVNSLEARVPFGDLDFAEYVMSLDPALKMNTTGKGKYLLRRAFAEGNYLPESILWREKAAFSDAVGHSMVDYLKEYAEAQYTDEQFAEGCKKYHHAQPFTKESLLYRDLFEKHYPGQGEMIADFWMPNKDWEGCDVNDPSARVLSNYGDSGK